MGVSKVKLNGKTLVDLTGDTVDRHNLPQGVTAHNAAGEKVTGEFSIDDMMPGFTEAGKRENIKSGEKVSMILGKIAKWFSDLKPAAFLALTNNLLANVAGTALDAVQGAVLKGLWDQHETKINKINSDLSIETSSFRLFGLRWNCIKFGKIVFVNVDGNTTEILAANTWSNKVSLPFKARYNSTWTGVNSDYSKGLSYIKVESTDNTVSMRSTAEIGSEDRLLRIQFTYICT